jgi:hypothetical protein
MIGPRLSWQSAADRRVRWSRLSEQQIRIRHASRMLGDLGVTEADEQG